MGNEGSTRISQKLRLLTGRRGLPSSTRPQSSTWPLAHPGAGEGGVSEGHPPGKAKDPKGWRWPFACWPGEPWTHLSRGHVCVQAQVCTRPISRRVLRCCWEDWEWVRKEIPEAAGVPWKLQVQFPQTCGYSPQGARRQGVQESSWWGLSLGKVIIC